MGWDVSVEVYDWISNNYDQYQEYIGMLDHAPIDTAFDFCQGDDGMATGEDITACSLKIANWADMSDSTRDYMYRFGQKYWHLVDQDGDGALNKHEFTDIWVETDTDGDVHSKTIMENIQFQLSEWAWLMEN